MEELELIFDEEVKRAIEAEYGMLRKIERELLFHNTVPIPEEQLPEARDTAAKQNGIVLDFFRKRFAYKYTPTKVHEILESEGEKILLTSVRRSITNLTKMGRLIKCSWDEREMGAFGTPNRTWRYNSEFINRLNPQK
jgi:hypothetical protein